MQARLIPACCLVVIIKTYVRTPLKILFGQEFKN